MTKILMCGKNDMLHVLKKRLDGMFDVKVTLIDLIHERLDSRTIFYQIENTDILIVDINTISNRFEPYFMTGVGKAKNKFVIGVAPKDYLITHLNAVLSDKFLIDICDKIYDYDELLESIGDLL